MTMRRLLPIAFLVAIPVVGLALDYTNTSLRYKDAPFSRPEAAGISVLTNIGAVSGNADGTFAPARTLNRAEFLKIALLAGGKDATVSPRCFGDVAANAWYNHYVCAGKSLGVVQGYPDGLFHPERLVNYAEAVKMLAVIFDLRLPQYIRAPDHWYDPYFDAANSLQLGLDGVLPGASITRGQMARLAAAFVAQSKGELASYRAAEEGRTISSSSSSTSSSSPSSAGRSSISSASSVSSISSVSSVSSSSASSQSSASSLSPDFPARSHFLFLGEWSRPIASATFTSQLEPASIRSITVKMKTKIDSIDRLQVIDRDGVTIGTLALDGGDANKLTWKASFSTGVYLLPKDTERTLGVRALLKAKDSGGSSEVIVQVDTFTIIVEGQWTHNTYSSAPPSFSFPKHQTTQALITGIQNTLPSRGVLPIGPNQVLASFAFTARTVPGISPRVESVDFTVTKSSTIAVSNWSLRRANGVDVSSCSVSENIVSCPILSSQDIGTIGTDPLVLRLSGDVAVDQGAQYPFLQADLASFGTIGTNGAVRWTDQTGHFNWIDIPDVTSVSGIHWQG